MTLSLHFAVRSDVGLLRDGNEDAAYAGPRLLAVADGMGGHAAGEVASRLAIASVAPLDEGSTGGGEGDVNAALRAAVERAQDEIRHRVAADAALDGMGTTLTALVWTGNDLGLVHVGDSRAYLFRDRILHRITNDHTYVQDLVDTDQITADEALSHPQRSLLTKALDGRSLVEPDVSVRSVRAGDRYLLCSDGLCGVVRDEALALALQAADVTAAADQLVELALRAGGPDNITVVVCDLIEADDAPPDRVVVGAAADLAVGPSDGDIGAGPAVLAEDERSGRRGPAGTRWRARGPLWAVLAIGLVLVLAGLGGWLWTRTQYFVGVSGERVAIFRGVAWSVAGLSLHSVSEHVAVDPAQLPEYERERLRAGIAAPTLPQARRVATRLAAEQCSAAAPAPVPPAARGPNPSAATTAPAVAPCGVVK